MVHINTKKGGLRQYSAFDHLKNKPFVRLENNTWNETIHFNRKYESITETGW